jgi:23S rRNA-/tRNA-specific pseudouridylate synthase
VARALACNGRQPVATRLHELPNLGLLVLDKPAGLYVEAVAESQGGAPAHRLDRDTSGVLLVAAGDAQKAVLARLSALFARPGAIRKAYVGAVNAAPPDWPPGATVLSGHGRSAGGLWRAYAAEDVGAALPSGGGTVKATTTTLTRLSAAGEGPALLLAAPEQGRTHQIRLAAQLAGAPLAGDVRYGGACVSAGDAGIETHCLHAALLALSHPVFGTPLVIAAPLPGWVDACGPDARARAEAVLVAWY